MCSHVGADSEWALYGMDVVSCLLRSVGDGECGSWTAADVSFCCIEVHVQVGSRWISAGGYGWMRVPTIVGAECGV